MEINLPSLSLRKLILYSQSKLQVWGGYAVFITQMRVNSCFKHCMHTSAQCRAAEDAEDLYYKDEEDWVKQHELRCILFFTLIIQTLTGCVRCCILPGALSETLQTLFST